MVEVWERHILVEKILMLKKAERNDVNDYYVVRSIVAWKQPSDC
jgi:hypothetical protein